MDMRSSRRGSNNTKNNRDDLRFYNGGDKESDGKYVGPVEDGSVYVYVPKSESGFNNGYFYKTSERNQKGSYDENYNSLVSMKKRRGMKVNFFDRLYDRLTL